MNPACTAPERRAGASTESCTMAETTTVSQSPATTHLFDSVPLLVNPASAGLALPAAATCSRASSTTARARRPSECTEDGLPATVQAVSIAAHATGRRGAVAL